jgi:hypothetical protein
VGFFGVHFLRPGAVVSTGAGAVVVESEVSGFAASATDGSSAGVGGVVDFGCHFFLSGVGGAEASLVGG